MEELDEKELKKLKRKETVLKRLEEIEELGNTVAILRDKTYLVEYRERQFMVSINSVFKVKEHEKWLIYDSRQKLNKVLDYFIDMEFLELPLKFGKYKGKTLMEIYDKKDVKYVKWILENFEWNFKNRKLQNSMWYLLELFKMEEEEKTENNLESSGNELDLHYE